MQPFDKLRAKFKILILILLPLAFLILYVLPAFRGDLEIKADIYLGPLRIHLYGLLMALAILAGYLVARRFAPKFGIAKEFVEGVFPWVVLGGFLGARWYYVIFSWDYFQSRPAEILAFWRGGLAIHGAIIGGTLAGLIYAKVKRVSLLHAVELGFLVLPLGQCLGRWGNFFNQEAFGRPTNLPWKMYVNPFHRPPEFLESQYFHPTFLYESVWNLLLFFILLMLVPGRPGRVAGLYLVFYGLGRFWIESLRIDSFYINSLRVDQLASIVIFASGLIIFVSCYVRATLEKSHSRY